MNEYKTYEILTTFREPLITQVIKFLNIEPDSRGIDIGCGIGRITRLLANKIGLKEKLTGLDFSNDFLNYARKNSKHENIEFIQGDINRLQLQPHSFDWIWSMDTVWAGSKEFGCPAETPDEILNQMYRILKPGGKIYLLFWTSQKLLPGYPLLEARLNTSTSANAPFVEAMSPDHHVLNCKRWLAKANFKNIRANTFLGDISGPFSEEKKNALTTFFQMFWSETEKEVSKADWEKFNALCSPDSNEFILNQPDYYGFYSYTLFQGRKE